MNFIDLFAGAGGLSEGFIRAGFKPIAHVEIDSHACDTLRTRAAYHFLESEGKSAIYNQYLKGELDRGELWSYMPSNLRSSIINREISEETKTEIFNSIDDLLGENRKVDLLIGGPPCQAYSLVGRSRDPHRMENDQRNYLFKDYAAYLKKYKPKFFVFENVLGLLSAGNKKYFNEMRELFREYGYETDYRILKSEEYGVLQKRRRVILIGRRGKKPFVFPELETWSTEDFRVLPDLFSDLPPLQHGEGTPFTNYSGEPTDYLKDHHLRNGVDFVTQHYTRPHNANDLKIYRKAIEAWVNKGERLKYDALPDDLKTHKNNSSFLDRYKVVNGNGCSHTMVAHISKDGHYYIYPDISQIRSLSVREAARIQSFPDDYYFEGGRTAAFRQIGNAVPPLMAESIANSIKEIARL